MNSSNINKSISNNNNNNNGSNNACVNMSMLPIYYQNIRSVCSKENIHSILKSVIYNIICLSETWLNNNCASENYFPDRFSVYRTDRNVNNNDSNRGGGVAILVDNKYKSVRLSQFENDQLEGVCVKVTVRSTDLIIYLVYIPPNASQETYYNHLNCIKSIYVNNISILVIGDFNLCNVKWKENDECNSYLPSDVSSSETKEFLQKICDIPLYQLNNIVNVSCNVLDLIYTNDVDDFNVKEAPITITSIDKTDKFHVPVEIGFSCIMGEKVKKYREIFLYDKGNFARMCRQLEVVNFTHEFNSRNVEDSIKFFYEKLETVVLNNVPKVKIYEKNKPKWWCKELQIKKNKRNKEWKKKCKTGNGEAYEIALAEFNKLNAEKHSEYVGKIQNEILSNPSEFWKYANEKRKCSVYPTTMKFRENTSDTPSGIADLFADSFKSYYAHENEVINWQNIFDSINGEEEINVSIYDVEIAIKNLKCKSSIGFDGVSPKIMKGCVSVLAWPMYLLLQKSFDCGEIPAILKTSRIVPIFKKGDKSNVENYRIVAIGSVLLKIMEKAVYFKLKNIIEPKLSTKQHGFRSNRSATTNLMNLSIAAHDAFSRMNQLDMFSGDFKNAFDKVHHGILVEKLGAFGLGKKTIMWLKSFLCDRINYVQIGDVKSKNFNASSGVPAGSTLGPLMFVAFIDDVVKCVVYALVLMFADDIKIMLEIKSYADTYKLQTDLNNFFNWCVKNKLFLNEAKCAIISIRRTNDFYSVEYKINETVIKRVEQIKDLGVLVDSKLCDSER